MHRTCGLIQSQDGSFSEITLTNVLDVPSFTDSLFSVTCAQESGFELTFPADLTMNISRDGKLLGQGHPGLTKFHLLQDHTTGIPDNCQIPGTYICPSCLQGKYTQALFPQHSSTSTCVLEFIYSLLRNHQQLFELLTGISTGQNTKPLLLLLSSEHIMVWSSVTEAGISYSSLVV
ncbi:hypothetical protein HMI56_001127 [Coelomomyces lativittatus]|nr:hypothetical protein HMI56_001127 [Coelomomyces lativittatus]